MRSEEQSGSEEVHQIEVHKAMWFTSRLDSSLVEAGEGGKVSCNN